MMGRGSTPVSATRPANTETTLATSGLSASATPWTWARVRSAVTFNFDALGGEFADQRQGRLALGVGDGNLDVDVFLPVADFECLPPHVWEIVGKDLEGNGFVGDDLQHGPGEGLVVGDADFFHEGRVGGQALDVRFFVERDDALAVRTVGENFDGEINQQIRAHRGRG